MEIDLNEKAGTTFFWVALTVIVVAVMKLLGFGATISWTI